MLIWLVSTLFAADAGASCGSSCEAVVREVGTQKVVGGLPFRVNDTVHESDASGRFVFDSNDQSDITPILLSPEWRLVQSKLIPVSYTHLTLPTILLV